MYEYIYIYTYGSNILLGCRPTFHVLYDSTCTQAAFLTKQSGARLFTMGPLSVHGRDRHSPDAGRRHSRTAKMLCRECSP